MPRGSSSSAASAWARRGIIAAVLVAAAVLPGHMARSGSSRCQGSGCGSSGRVLWRQPLFGQWVAAAGLSGTVPSVGQAFAGAGASVAAIGVGMTVQEFDVGTGLPRWAATLTGFPAGSSIVSVRAWPQVVTVGVAIPGSGAGGTRQDVVLTAAGGQRLGSYPAAVYGGAVLADAARTVVVAALAVTSYANATGRVVWSRPTGPREQAWRVDGRQLYVTEAAGGYLGTAPVTALRRISLATGAERVVRPAKGQFAGTLSAAFDGVVLFSSPGGLAGYSGSTGALLWHRGPGLVPDVGGSDQASGVIYLARGERLQGISPVTGANVRHAFAPGASGLYGIRAGVALGLDQGALGDAWGYSVARRQVIWTTSPLPWPHYFVDLSGIGGSADPASGVVLLASCARTGDPVGGTAGTGQAGQAVQRCLRPELVAVSR